MNVLTILKKEHEQFYPLFETIEKAHEIPKDQLNAAFKELERLLLAHMRAEEKVFYEELLKHEEVKSLIEKSYQAHHFTKISLTELHVVPYNHSSWKPKFEAIRDNLLTHIKEEEEVLFPQLEELLDKKDLEKIGRKLMDYKEEQTHSLV